MAVALAAVDAMAAPDVTDGVDADMTVVADTGGRGNDRGRRSDRIPSSTTFRPENCPDQDAVDRTNPSIVNRYVTGDRIFVGDHVYNKEMNATERHAVFQIRADLKAHKNPLGGASRKRTSEVAALQCTMRSSSVRSSG